jgi:hypothetical protein
MREESRQVVMLDVVQGDDLGQSRPGNRDGYREMQQLHAMRDFARDSAGKHVCGEHPGGVGRSPAGGSVGADPV